MKKDLVCQWNIDHKIGGCVADHCAGMYRVGSLFDKSAHLFVDLRATKAILAAFRQTYPSRLKSATLILRILKALYLLVPFRVDDIAGQVLHGRFIVGRDAVAAENVESGMFPCGEHPYLMR
jgi:hypothetical protein